jgi:hypothetical protein
MTYITKPSISLAETLKARLNKIDLSKTTLRKIAIGGVLSCAGMMAIITLSPNKSDEPAAQSHAEFTANPEYTTKSQTSPKIPGQAVTASTLETKASAIPGEKFYRTVDNAVRDVQMDLMVKGKPLRTAVQNNDNPIKAFLIKLMRLITLPGIFIGLAFIFCLGFLGFIRPDGEDLGNY